MSWAIISLIRGSKKHIWHYVVMAKMFHCYIYRRPDNGKILYVGYATEVSRAFTDGHNEKITEFVNSGEDYEIYISGPYRDEEEARNVEAALVSALRPEFNQIEQPGKKFHPLGIPEEFSSRRSEPTLDPHELGRATGGCIIVYCNLTSQLKSGASKVGPTSFSDQVILDNIKGHWAVKKFLPLWGSNPETSPTSLVAVQGTVKDRIIIASAQINSENWLSTPSAPWESRLFEIPLLLKSGLDMFGLRGRRVDIRFGAGTSNCTMVVDADGLVLHGYRIKGKRNVGE
jgi:predicted GIY-YIG superfamily endonuclease